MIFFIVTFIFSCMLHVVHVTSNATLSFTDDKSDKISLGSFHKNCLLFIYFLKLETRTLLLWMIKWILSI